MADISLIDMTAMTDQRYIPQEHTLLFISVWCHIVLTRRQRQALDAVLDGLVQASASCAGFHKRHPWLQVEGVGGRTASDVLQELRLIWASWRSIRQLPASAYDGIERWHVMTST